MRECHGLYGRRGERLLEWLGGMVGTEIGTANVIKIIIHQPPYKMTMAKTVLAKEGGAFAHSFNAVYIWLNMVFVPSPIQATAQPQRIVKSSPAFFVVGDLGGQQSF